MESGKFPLALALLFGAVVAPSMQAQDYKVLYTFTGGTDGANPLDGLIRDAAGNLYGTTAGGGPKGEVFQLAGGVVFKLDSSGRETVLHSFTGNPDGSQPTAGLVRDSDGNFYGTTYYGGNYSGTVFKLEPNGSETVLHDFDITDGAYPEAGLVRDSAGNLYGTTSSGGIPANTGCVFKVDTAGTETTLYCFTGSTDGGYPFGGLIQDQDGNLYGTTFFGGDLSTCGGVGCGVVFKFDPTGQETILYDFKGGAEGLEPTSSLVRDKDGNLYGTTYEGGEFGAGTVFKLDTAGNESVLHSFAGGSDGANPNAGLIREPEGNLYGTTALGGVNRSCPSDNGCGTVFRVDTHGRASVLHRFTGRRGGAYPQAALILDRDRNLYGTTYAGGASDAGLVFNSIFARNVTTTPLRRAQPA